MGFNLVNLAITIRTEDAHFLCNYLSLSGKKYQAACRYLSCHWPDRECANCLIQDTCGWHLVFGQALTSDPVALKRHQKPPLPFVFSFPRCTGNSENHNPIVIGLVVIGLAIPHLEMLLNGLLEIISDEFSPVSAEISQIACRDYQDTFQKRNFDSSVTRSGNLVPDSLVIVSTEGLLDSRNWIGSTMQIQLQSPLRLLSSGHIAVSFDFAHFARSVMRRVSSLAYYYGESEYDCDYKALARQVDAVICTDEHFCFTKLENRKLSGIIGHGSFCGDFSQILPFLLIGTYLHTGKGASFGMGSYDVLP